MASDEGQDEFPSEELTDLIGGGPVAFTVRGERQFQPWHLPRKQYVREAQWSREIGFLVRDLGLAHSELRYLTLPGVDLLDVRHLIRSICVEHDVQLKYLGFNTSAASGVDESELNSSQFSVNRLERVHVESEVYPDDFRTIGENRSKSRSRIKRAGYFHAINLDLCGGFAGSEKASSIPNYFTALKALLQHQASGDDDFLLFITTRMDDQSVDSETLSVLDEIAQNIHDTCSDYAVSFAEHWGCETGEDERLLREIVDSSEAFMLGLTQWIITNGISVGLKASVKSFMTYRTGSGSGPDDIVSLAIRFKSDPLVQPDAQGLVRQVPPQPSPDEKACAQSHLVPRRVAERHLVDELLRTQAEHFERCLNDSSELLSSAGYDDAAYRQWVSGGS